MSNHQFLIASYQRDFPWLRQCLRSLRKFSTGFLPPVVVVSKADEDGCRALVAEAGSDATVYVLDGPGFGRAQVSMMSGDLACPGADYVWLLGSDCMAVRPFGPEAYCDAKTGLPVMLWNSWTHMKVHGRATLFWRAGVEEALGGSGAGEFMRRLPIAYPRYLFPKVRAEIAKRHGGDFNAYVFDRVNRVKNFSESNVMGEFAYRHFREYYVWENIDNKEGAWPVLPIVQHWSHGGIDRPRDQDGRPPREVIIEALGSI